MEKIDILEDEAEGCTGRLSPEMVQKDLHLHLNSRKNNLETIENWMDEKQRNRKRTETSYELEIDEYALEKNEARGGEDEMVHEHWRQAAHDH